MKASHVEANFVGGKNKHCWLISLQNFFSTLIVAASLGRIIRPIVVEITSNEQSKGIIKYAKFYLDK
jgi:hypothetical protein